MYLHIEYPFKRREWQDKSQKTKTKATTAMNLTNDKITKKDETDARMNIISALLT